jgi:hypothetical protein
LGWRASPNLEIPTPGKVLPQKAWGLGKVGWENLLMVVRLGEGNGGDSLACVLGTGAVSTEVRWVGPRGGMGNSSGALLALFPQEGG